MTALIAPRFYNQTIVQTAQIWPTDDAGWTTQRMFATSGGDGLANDVGSMSLFHPAGEVVWPGETTPITTLPLDIVGHYVRVCVEDPAGSLVDPTSLKYYSAIWWGKVVARGWKPASGGQAGLEVNYECAGLLIILDQITPFHHYEMGVGLAKADITLPLAFNANGAKKSGNRSGPTIGVGTPPIATYIFDRRDALHWTARQVVEYLLALAYDTNPGGPTWTLTGQTTALDFVEKWDLAGMTVLESITRLINPRNGIGFRMVMDGFQPTIEVHTLVADDIVAGAYTLPASDLQVDLDLTNDAEIVDFAIKETQVATYGRVAIVGGADVYIMTMCFKGDGSGQFIKDWTDAEADALDLLTEDDDEDQRNAGIYAKVYRRFKLSNAWNGSNHDGSFTLPVARTETFTPPALHGDNGYSGILEAGGTIIEGSNFQLLRDLPIPMGYNWDDQDVADVDLNKKPEDPKAFVKLVDGSWMTLETYCECTSLEIQIDDKTATITLGRNAAEYIRDLIAAGDELYFTVAVKHQLPLMVSWNRPSAGEPVEQYRSITRLRPHLTRATIAINTYFRVVSTVIQQRDATVEVDSDVDNLLAALALAVAWYSVPDYEISWVKQGDIGTDYGRPGTLYTSVEYRTGLGTSEIVETQCIVTRRDWDFADEKGSTKITTKRIQIDIETVF